VVAITERWLAWHTSGASRAPGNQYPREAGEQDLVTDAVPSPRHIIVMIGALDWLRFTCCDADADTYDAEQIAAVGPQPKHGAEAAADLEKSSDVLARDGGAASRRDYWRCACSAD
jgi:hypothetical protein